MSLAREALANSNNDVERALSWLERHMSASAAKAAKVSGRSTNEGTIAVSLLSEKRVSMVHLGCETDFVARNDVFLNTARGVAGTAAFLDVPTEGEPPKPKVGVDPILTFPPSALLSAPLIALPGGADEVAPIPSNDPTTIQQSLLSALGSTGENLKLLRAVTFAAPFPSTPEIRYVPGCYAHGGRSDTEGRVAAITVLAATSLESDKPIASLIHGPKGSDLEADLSKMARTISRQVVGFPTRAISRKDAGAKELDEGEVLLEQSFMMMGEERKVGEVLEEWGAERGIKVDVVGIRRWAVGDAIAIEECAEAA
jgi:elongation factor Ts